MKNRSIFLEFKKIMGNTPNAIFIIVTMVFANLGKLRSQLSYFFAPRGAYEQFDPSQGVVSCIYLTT